MEDAAAPSRADGLIRIWLERKLVDRLGQMRGPGESYSDSHPAAGERVSGAREVSIGGQGEEDCVSGGKSIALIVPLDIVRSNR